MTGVASRTKVKMKDSRRGIIDVDLRAIRNAQLPLDAKVQRADHESDEIEEALGQLLASQTADCSPSSS
jgi:hypothetical protein